MPDTLSFDLFVDQPFQTTVRRPVAMDGIGLHSGRYVRMSICPAPANHGIKFRRTDVADRRQTITAHADFAEQSRLCTRIVNDDGVGLETIEHLMAGFAGIGLDNALVEIDAAEVPILDGSSQPVIAALGDAGLELLPAKRKYLTLLKPVEVVLDGGSWARLAPADSLKVDIRIEFDDPAIGTQTFTYRHKDGSFATELACARTFCQMRDVALMQNAGRAMGGSLGNALVVDNGTILNEGGLRIDGEFARHKVLDCLGDLLLFGMPVKAQLTAVKPGHALSTQLIQAVLADPSAFAIVEAGATKSRSDSFVLPELAAAAMA
jgi:UDP-3-O-[3-hydroxymyristoyl] N-acetylglucosamine deacetylase